MPAATVPAPGRYDIDTPALPWLAALPAWVLWTWGTAPAPDAKRPKVPFYVNHGKRWGALDWGKLVTHAEAEQARRTRIGFTGEPTFAGLGLYSGAPVPGSAIQFLDFDNALHADGTMARPDACEWAWASGGYLERSPSGRGLRVWGFGQQFQTIKAPGVEAYSTGQFGTFTGDVLRWVEQPVDLAPFVREVLAPRHGGGSMDSGFLPDIAQAFADAGVPLDQYELPHFADTTTPESLLRSLRKCGPCGAIFDGDWAKIPPHFFRPDGSPDQSLLDWRLLYALAGLTTSNELLLTVFRASACWAPLGRKEKHRSAYLMRTLARARRATLGRFRAQMSARLAAQRSASVSTLLSERASVLRP